MASTSNKSQLQFAFQTFEKDLQLNINKATQFYNILRTILSARINDRFIYTNIIANSQKLTVLKEEMIIQEIFDLDSQRFPPRIRDIKDIAN